MRISTLLRHFRTAAPCPRQPRFRALPHQVTERASLRPRAAVEALERRALLSAEFGSAFALGGIDGEEGNGIAVDAAGNVYVVGSFSGTMDADPAPDREALLHSADGSPDAFLAKYDAAGALVWARQMGGAGWDIAYGVAVDGSGNVHVTGSYEGAAQFGDVSLSSTGSAEDAFVTKLDANGTFLWADGLAGTSGGDYREFGFELGVDDAGNVYTAGSFELNGPSAAFIAKHSPTGQRQWAHQIGDGQSGTADGFGVAVDAEGNSFISGHYGGEVDFDPSAGSFVLKSITVKERGYVTSSHDAYVLALDPAGNFRWAGSMGGQGDDQGLGIALDGVGNLHVTGQFGASLQTGENPPSTTNDFDPGSGTLSLPNAGSMDIFAVNLTGSGDLIWGRSMGGTGWDFGFDVIVDGAGDVYLTGGFGYNSGSSAGSTADMDPGSGTYTLSSAGYSDIFVSRFDSAGNFVWAAGMGGTNDEYGKRIALDDSGGVYTVGSFHGEVDFDPGDGTHNLTSASSWTDVFVSKLVQVEPAPLPPALSIGDVVVTEGNSGTTTATFTITRSGDTSQEVTVDYATADGSALAGSDYVATAGTLTFAAGQTTMTITVMILGDTTREADEIFYLNLLNASANALLADGQGAGTITNDDSKGAKK